MYLIDTNIFLEILLGQEKSDESEEFLKIAFRSNDFFVSSFSIHSIEVIMTRHEKIKELIQFLIDLGSSNIRRIETDSECELNALKLMKKNNIDFDDAVQLEICNKNKFKIVSFDKHFDKTSVKRLEPKIFLK